MKKITLTAVALGLMLTAPMATAEVKSLRGDSELSADAQQFDRKDEVYATGGFKRAWKLQPPAVPHKTDNDRIVLQENTCLNCHSTETFEKEKAPKLGDSHYLDMEGNVMQEMSMRRYFCNQCHVPQVDAEPLVENLFEGDN
ncbi:nitrate reductase cytochrome c-type subunit [Alisedimentitalea sp. MJ-SS2]|uniref:nitrate reductase cytochrome c-type subunit n=1 Tax=Aliisedimentitalea sp. MJ-SS2 TaxID=3049795 RepID=UPI00290C17DA|nr:nitrate reductase cytochrome c-type subunit [Alisedimentitalea sp. MJ-SS2]MDU8926770.1 nitrate reductase cytochrome c-type subunit [Alisedimentitalea sp. MJ-SS2]